jgi:hypothetical protein
LKFQPLNYATFLGVDDENFYLVKIFSFSKYSSDSRSSQISGPMWDFDFGVLTRAPYKRTGFWEEVMDRDLTSEEHATVYCTTHPGLQGRPDPRYFDAKRAFEWYDYCKNNHECDEKRIGGDGDWTRLPGMKVIDCENNTIIPIPQNVPYLTLSYVWGERVESDQHEVLPDGTSSGTEEHTQQYRLPETLSPTIVDSIAVTKALGFRYLWIDQYCIDQQNPDEVEFQTSRMNQIYVGSELTIVMASGDQHCHIPGVGTPREPESRITYEDLIICPPRAHVLDEIQASNWMTRAWTFQEAYLSLRLLVFTPTQSYFECQSNVVYESSKVPSASGFRSVTGIIRGHEYGSGSDMGIRLNIPATWQFLRYIAYASEYSRRNLTFPSDSLRAFAGVTRRLDSLKEDPIYSMSGIPSYRRASIS